MQWTPFNFYLIGQIMLPFLFRALEFSLSMPPMNFYPVGVKTILWRLYRACFSRVMHVRNLFHARENFFANIYIFANKACQSETKIENKYRQCTINILKIWYLGSCPQCSLNVLMNMHVTVDNCLLLLKCSANWMHIAFIVITAMKLTILLKQFINNLWNFIVDFAWWNDEMHLTYRYVDQHIW